MTMFKLAINGKVQEVEADPDTPLLWVLRDILNMVGTRFGCGIGSCGACTVLVDGQPAISCLTPISSIKGAITTIEGLAETATGKRLQEAWVELDVAQCGYCQGGQLLAAAALLENNSTPTDDDIDAGMSANLCRCGTYNRIREAIKHAASGGARD